MNMKNKIHEPKRKLIAILCLALLISLIVPMFNNGQDTVSAGSNAGQGWLISTTSTKNLPKILFYYLLHYISPSCLCGLNN